jgi:hypothetical protein
MAGFLTYNVNHFDLKSRKRQSCLEQYHWVDMCLLSVLTDQEHISHKGYWVMKSDSLGLLN